VGLPSDKTFEYVVSSELKQHRRAANVVSHKP
jgi:hypothetical protein